MNSIIFPVLDSKTRWGVVEGESLAVLHAMPDACVDAVITDPPYSSGGQFRGDRTHSTTSKYVGNDAKIERADFAGDNRDQRSFLLWCTLWLSECLRVAKPGAPICLFTDWRQLPTTTDALQAGGWVWRGLAPWEKPSARPSMGRFAAACEYVVWGSSGAMPKDRGVGCLPGFWRHVVKLADKHHIAGKPTPLMQEVVRICEPGGVVLDPFCGSGSTGVACLREGLRFIGCEVLRSNVVIAKGRMVAEAECSDIRSSEAGQAALFGETEGAS